MVVSARVFRADSFGNIQQELTMDVTKMATSELVRLSNTINEEFCGELLDQIRIELETRGEYLNALEAMRRVQPRPARHGLGCE